MQAFSSAIELKAKAARQTGTGVLHVVPKSEHVIGGSPAFWYAKFVFDISVALLLLPLVGLCALVIAFLNLGFNRGPLFFVQDRVGKNNRVFPLIKFRSMAQEAKRDSRFATEERHRITRLGALLRRTRIDELPQIFNILRGQMSFIGPRPEQVEIAARYAQLIPQYNRRHTVRPGISGLAQVLNGYADCDESTRLKLERDLEYIHGAGWKMETYVLLRTILVILTGFGAR